ncbi:MAG: alpha-galactosidase, partial [Chitinivibrionales bacterium]|nr:alpha-galactosidase [Chitinivibrionales bacterium]MBD3396169.1 alpha-galactosidase [Chitinivibrionales bacterium]
MPDTEKYVTDIAEPGQWDQGTPTINGPSVYGAGVGTKTRLPVPTTGRRPLLFSAEGLPEGLFINSKTGVIQGVAKEKKEATVRVMVNNDEGSDERVVKVISGGRLALTPPLGWNSWNVWGTSIDQQN